MHSSGGRTRLEIRSDMSCNRRLASKAAQQGSHESFCTVDLDERVGRLAIVMDINEFAREAICQRHAASLIS